MLHYCSPAFTTSRRGVSIVRVIGRIALLVLLILAAVVWVQSVVSEIHQEDGLEIFRQQVR
jgi:hypothetical protein